MARVHRLAVVGLAIALIGLAIDALLAIGKVSRIWIVDESVIVSSMIVAFGVSITCRGKIPVIVSI